MQFRDDLCKSVAQAVFLYLGEPQSRNPQKVVNKYSSLGLQLKDKVSTSGH